MPAQHELRAEAGCFTSSVAQSLFGSLIVDADSDPFRNEKAYDSEPALAEPHDHRFRPRELHVHLSFRVARLNTANMIAMIQKRTMTRGSGQPFFSKWWWIGAIKKILRPVIRK